MIPKYEGMTEEQMDAKAAEWNDGMDKVGICLLLVGITVIVAMAVMYFHG